jgi:hypothetical protein
MNRKHSYRELERRRFNRFVLKALQAPDELKNDIELYEGITSKHTLKDKGMMQTALEVANTLKREFPILGAAILKRYTPYVNQIKEALSAKELTLTGKPYELLLECINLNSPSIPTLKDRL